MSDMVKLLRLTKVMEQKCPTQTPNKSPLLAKLEILHNLGGIVKKVVNVTKQIIQNCKIHASRRIFMHV